MTKGYVLDPRAIREDDIASLGPDAGVLAGKTVGFRLDEFWRAWDWVAEIWADEFRKAGAKVVRWRAPGGRTGDNGDPAAPALAKFLDSIDVAVVGLANCGSCTGWTIRDALAAAAKGLPTVAVSTDNFKVLAANLAERGGRSGLRLHVLPYPLNERLKSDVDPIAYDHLPKILKTMGAHLQAREAAE